MTTQLDYAVEIHMGVLVVPVQCPCSNISAHTFATNVPNNSRNEDAKYGER